MLSPEDQRPPYFSCGPLLSLTPPWPLLRTTPPPPLDVFLTPPGCQTPRQEARAVAWRGCTPEGDRGSERSVERAATTPSLHCPHPAQIRPPAPTHLEECDEAVQLGCGPALSEVGSTAVQQRAHHPVQRNTARISAPSGGINKCGLQYTDGCGDEVVDADSGSQASWPRYSRPSSEASLCDPLHI